jgi:hypothetical protein
MHVYPNVTRKLQQERQRIANVPFPLWCANPVAGISAATSRTIAERSSPGLPPLPLKYRKPLEQIEGPCFANSD